MHRRHYRQTLCLLRIIAQFSSHLLGPDIPGTLVTEIMGDRIPCLHSVDERQIQTVHYNDMW